MSKLQTEKPNPFKNITIVRSSISLKSNAGTKEKDRNINPQIVWIEKFTFNKKPLTYYHKQLRNVCITIQHSWRVFQHLNLLNYNFKGFDELEVRHTRTPT